MQAGETGGFGERALHEGIRFLKLLLIHQPAAGQGSEEGRERAVHGIRGGNGEPFRGHVPCPHAL